MSTSCLRPSLRLGVYPALSPPSPESLVIPTRSPESRPCSARARAGRRGLEKPPGSRIVQPPHPDLLINILYPDWLTMDLSPTSLPDTMV
jgi:hypothetical protein